MGPAGPAGPCGPLGPTGPCAQAQPESWQVLQPQGEEQPQPSQFVQPQFVQPQFEQPKFVQPQSEQPQLEQPQEEWKLPQPEGQPQRDRATWKGKIATCFLLRRGIEHARCKGAQPLPPGQKGECMFPPPAYSMRERTRRCGRRTAGRREKRKDGLRGFSLL